MNFRRPYGVRRWVAALARIFAWAHLLANALFALSAVIFPYSSPQTSWRWLSIVILFADAEHAKLLGKSRARSWKGSDTQQHWRGLSNPTADLGGAIARLMN
jgi:hypothetical protein